MRLLSVLGVLGIVATLVSGCAYGAEKSGPAPAAEPTGKERLAHDASLFKLSIFVTDDGKGAAGGAQRAMAVLRVVDTRGSLVDPDVLNCRILVKMPIRHHALGIITPDHAAEMSATAANAPATVVIHSQPQWLSVLFCRKFAGQIQAELNALNLGARVFPQ